MTCREDECRPACLFLTTLPPLLAVLPVIWPRLPSPRPRAIMATVRLSTPLPLLLLLLPLLPMLSSLPLLLSHTPADQEDIPQPATNCMVGAPQNHSPFPTSQPSFQFLTPSIESSISGPMLLFRHPCSTQCPPLLLYYAQFPKPIETRFQYQFFSSPM